MISNCIDGCVGEVFEGSVIGVSVGLSVVSGGKGGGVVIIGGGFLEKAKVNKCGMIDMNFV